MRNYDFSQQYISSGLAVAVPARSAINFDIAAKIIRKTLSSSNVAAVIIAFLTFNLVIAALIRWIVFSPDERNAGGKFGIWIRAVLEALVRTVGLRGVGNDYISAASKLLEIFMAVVGTGLSATLFGLLTSAFVGSVGNQDDINPIELTTMRVATIYCSTAQTLLRQQYKKLTKIIHLNDPQKQLVNDRVNALFCPKTSAGKEIPTIEPIEGLEGQILLVDSWSTAMALLAAGKVDAVLGDWVALTYLSRQNYEQQIRVLPSAFFNEPYGWGISRASVSEDIRSDIDRALINNLRDVAWRIKLEGALGAGAVSPN
jgi:ABC-type amino acid transport substrate-binding protein